MRPKLRQSSLKRPRVSSSTSRPRRSPPPNRPRPCRAATVTAEANSDTAVADKLARHHHRQAIRSRRCPQGRPRRRRAFYKARDYKPLWVSNGAADDRAKAAIAYLAQVDSVGLDPTDYPAPDFKSATTADALAAAEIKFTNSVLTYARQAQIGRIHFTRVGADIQFDLVAPEPAKVLAKLADASDVAAALDSYNPPQPEFKALQEKLAELRNGADRQAGRGKAEAGWCASPRARSCAPA